MTSAAKPCCRDCVQARRTPAQSAAYHQVQLRKAQANAYKQIGRSAKVDTWFTGMALAIAVGFALVFLGLCAWGVWILAG